MKFTALYRVTATYFDNLFIHRAADSALPAWIIIQIVITSFFSNALTLKKLEFRKVTVFAP